ncbi:MAG: peptidase M41, partial [Crocinitomicaceae bacterium]
MSDQNKKRSFSIYWIYALLGVGLIAFQLYYNSSSTVVIKNKQSLYTLIEQKGIEKITIVNKEKAEFELNDTGKKYLKGKDGEFKEMAQSIEKNGADKNVVFELEDIGSYDNFENELKERQFSNYENKKETNYLGVILSYLLPFVIIIAIWIFVMRRMSGGGGGGGGSQIFNIGKSR